MLRIVDVTLRDGGYRNDFNFSENEIEELNFHLMEANIDYIEFGYFKGSFKPQPYHGKTSNIDLSFVAKVKNRTPTAKVCLMAHPHNISFEDLLNLKKAKLDLLRLCLRNQDMQFGLNMVAKAKEAGLFLSANLIRVTEIPLSQLIKNVQDAFSAGADIVYLADSNGSLIPSQTKEIFSRLNEKISGYLGFHAHNNLSLALANTIVAMENGVSYIDASVCGMGKGSGNLRLDILVGYLTKINQSHPYKLHSILKISEQVAQSIPFSNNPLPVADVLTGVFNLSMDTKAYIDLKSKSECINWYDCAYNFLNSQKDLVVETASV